MFSIDTVQEWALVILELIGIIMIACLGLIAAAGLLCLYMAKTIWYWDLNYFREDV